MNHVELGAALKMGLQMIIHSTRRTGRTSRMLDRVQPGDRIVCGNSTVARHIERELRLRDVPATVLVRNPWLSELAELRCSTSVHLEHTFVEALYERSLQNTSDNLTEILKRLDCREDARRIEIFTPPKGL